MNSDEWWTLIKYEYDGLWVLMDFELLWTMSFGGLWSVMNCELRLWSLIGYELWCTMNPEGLCTLIYYELLFYCCSSTVVSIFTPPYLPCLTHPCLPPSNLPALALSMCPLYMFLYGPSPIFPIIPLPLLWLLSVCSLFQCLWLYFHLLVLLIRFHL